MKKFLTSVLPWTLAGVLGVAVVLLLIRSGQRKASKPGEPPASGASAGHPSSPSRPLERKILYWTDPMTPGFKSDKPGKSPFMDMALVPVYDDGAAAGAEGSKGVEGYSSIQLGSDRQQLIGVQIGKVEKRKMSKTIRTVGHIAVDETALHHIHAKFEGYVEQLFVDYTGKVVRKGQPLVSIYSPDLLATEQEYLLAYRAWRQFSVSPNPDLVRNGKDLYDSARQRLLLWDIRPSDIERLEKTGAVLKALTLYSPIDGTVMAKNAVAGNRVMPGDSLFEIAGLERVWALADVYEYELPFVHVGQAAVVTLSYLPGRQWRGRVAFISPTVDEKTRTVKVRVELDNQDMTLKPDMFTEVQIEQSGGNVVAVPLDAVLSTGSRTIVFLPREGGRFEPREVKLGNRVDGYYQVVSGLAEGDRVVTQANFLIDSESRLKAALSDMAAPKSAPAEHPR
jgi:multidrug efflux pump subunit AcrA (membrane-fusion protein)